MHCQGLCTGVQTSQKLSLREAIFRRRPSKQTRPWARAGHRCLHGGVARRRNHSGEAGLNMTRTAGSPRPPVTAWNAELLRLSVFYSPGVAADPGRWWADLANAEPENTEAKPRIGTRRDTGHYEGGLLVMECQPGRADWLYAEEAQAGGAQIQGNLIEKMEVFSQTMGRWWPRCPGIMRMAFGAILALPAGSKEESYRLLSSYLNFDLDPEGSSDFAYQINRSRSSGRVEGLRINRFARWSSVYLVRGSLSVGESVAFISRSPVVGSHRCRLEMDINTSADWSGTLPEEALRELYAELVRLGLEIAREGDIP